MRTLVRISALIVLLFAVASSFQLNNYNRKALKTSTQLFSEAIPNDVSNIEDLPSSRVALRGLRSDRFRHPVDRQATAQLQRLPGLEQIVRRATPLVEEAVYLDNIATSIKVGPGQMPALHQLLVDACRILDIKDPPQLYVKQNPSPNAYTLAVQGRKPFIVLHTSLIDLMTPQEVQAVLAHELGHIKCEHGLWLSAANLVALGLLAVGGVPGQLLSEALSSLIMPWQRAAELTCDRAALLVAQDPAVVVSTILKLVGGVGGPALGEYGGVSPDEFLKQAEEYAAARSSRVGRLLAADQDRALTHPLPVVRAQELARWARGPEYRGLLRRGAPLAGGGAGAGAGEGLLC